MDELWQWFRAAANLIEHASGICDEQCSLHHFTLGFSGISRERQSHVTFEGEIGGQKNLFRLRKQRWNSEIDVEMQSESAKRWFKAQSLQMKEWALHWRGVQLTLEHKQLAIETKEQDHSGTTQCK